MPIPLGVLAVAGAGGGAGGGAYEQIESVILTSSQSSVTFSNIDTYASTYRHLQLRLVARTDRGNQLDTGTFIRLNGISTTSYSIHSLFGDGGAVSSTGQGTVSSILMNNMGANNSGTSVFGAAIIDILDFGSTSKNKTLRIFNGTVTTTETRIALSSGAFINTAAVTSVSINPQSGNNWVSGSRFSLYGLKG